MGKNGRESIWDYGAYLHDGAQAGSLFTYYASGQKAQEDKQAAELELANKDKNSVSPKSFELVFIS